MCVCVRFFLLFLLLLNRHFVEEKKFKVKYLFFQNIRFDINFVPGTNQSIDNDEEMVFYQWKNNFRKHILVLVLR